MADGIFDLTTAEHMFTKLRLEVEAFKVNETAGHAVNAIWTGYHLIEWIWNDRLRDNSHLRDRIGAQSEDALRAKVRAEHPPIKVVRALANGSKHFERRAGDPVTGVHRGAFSSAAFSKAFNVDHLFVEFDGCRHDIEHILDALLEYWDTFFTTYLR